MKQMIRIIVIALIAALSSDLSGQPYEHSLGVRAGYSSGISYKGFFRHRMTAVETDVLYNRHGFNLTALYEHHLEVTRNGRLMIYLGGGVFGGSWEAQLSAGLAAVAGIEYTVRDLPVNFCLDWKPMLNAYRLFEYDLLDFGISIRYRFNL